MKRNNNGFIAPLLCNTMINYYMPFVNIYVPISAFNFVNAPFETEVEESMLLC